MLRYNNSTTLVYLCYWQNPQFILRQQKEGIKAHDCYLILSYVILFGYYFVYPYDDKMSIERVILSDFTSL